jgi:carboxypeptidase Taq
LVRALASVGKPSERSFVGRSFDEGRQHQFTLHVLRAMGFDFEAGREDRSTHPFTSGLHPTDVRITNRFRPDNPLPAIFGAIHEGGHGLYEQGFAPEHAGTPLGQAASFGLHESQSRLWENLIGRSRPFWQAFFPALRKSFPTSLKGVDAERFYLAVNEVERSPIRVEADEVTYNLHIALRLRLEAALIRGSLEVADLPSAWNAGMEELLGVRPADDKEGVLQDIHWAWGEFGYFPTYTVGNLYSASLLKAAERAIPELWNQVRHGQLLELREWLRVAIHARGHLEDAEEIVRTATGESLTEGPFLDYLWTKYGEIYGVARG